MRLEPATGLYRLDIGTSQLQLYPVLRALGVEDAELKRAWGERLWRANAAKPDRGSLAKAYAKLVRHPDPAASPERQAREVREALEAMRVNPEAVALTLPELADSGAQAKSAASRRGAGVLLRTPSGWFLQENPDGTLRPVGGGYEAGDCSLRRTILREMQEELGIDPVAANRELRYLGRIVGGAYDSCGMFELPAPGWLAPGVYQASNAKDEKIKLVAVSSLEDPRYVGRHATELSYPGDVTVDEVVKRARESEDARTELHPIKDYLNLENLSPMTLRKALSKLSQPALQGALFLLTCTALPGAKSAAQVLPAWAPQYEAYLWQVENAEKKGYDRIKNSWRTYRDGDAPAVGPGIRVVESGIYSDDEVRRMLDQRVAAHVKNARRIYDAAYGNGSFEELPAGRQMALTDMDYDPGLALFPKFMAATST